MAFTLPGSPITMATQATAAADTTTFQPRVMMAITIVANEVRTEATTTTNHTNRAKLAASVLQSPQTYVPGFAAAALADLVTPSTATDQPLITRIETIWDAMAGLGS
jgi:hypothetical protein